MTNAVKMTMRCEHPAACWPGGSDFPSNVNWLKKVPGHGQQAGLVFAVPAKVQSKRQRKYEQSGAAASARDGRLEVGRRCVLSKVSLRRNDPASSSRIADEQAIAHFARRQLGPKLSFLPSSSSPQSSDLPLPSFQFFNRMPNLKKKKRTSNADSAGSTSPL